MNIAMFGARDNIGHPILEEALSRGHHVTAVERDSTRPSLSRERLKFASGNVLDPASVATAVAGHDVVISAVGPGQHTDPQMVVDAARSRMSAPATNGTTPALLFVPDISGFTQFVQATEIAHSRHIIEELLETLIEANAMGLQVSKVEGDAILFYRVGPAPTAEVFFQQVQKMFIAFHGHLRLYEPQRICQCGACTSAHTLTLKIVAHYGPITQSHIKEHVDLFGQDVITVHRLLKNDLPHHEYALFTQALGDEWPPAATPAWAPREEGSQAYDVGRVNYGYVPLVSLRRLVPEPTRRGLQHPRCDGADILV